MEQLFTMYPNYFPDQLRKSKPENSIIDKYLESRMKTRIDSKEASGNDLSFSKSLKDCNNMKQESAINPAMNLKSTPAKMASTKASNILENMRKASSDFQRITSSNIESNSDESYNTSNQNLTLPSGMRKDEPGEKGNVSGVNFKESTEHDNNMLGKEEFLVNHTYEYGKELEKTDEKDTASMKDSEDRMYWDITEKVARILKLVQGDDYEESQPECSQSERFPDCSTNVEIWPAQETHYSYYIFIVMVLTIAIGSFLKSTNRGLEKIKFFFDAFFASCWKWLKAIISPPDKNDGNLFLFMICTPMFVFLSIIYAGFSIVYYSNKALLSRVPDRVAEQINLNKIKELSR